MSEAATPASNPSSNATTTPAPEGAKTSVVDTLFDLGFGWAATGLKMGKAALEQSAKTLEQTAKTLETLANELEKKDTGKAA